MAGKPQLFVVQYSHLMKTIVVLHGWGHSKELWENFKNTLATDARVVALDLPGFGAEPRPNETWGIPEYKEWAKRKIEEVRDGNDVILLGHSFGGRIASLVASERPSWLKALVLYGSPSLRRPSLEIKLKIKVAKIMKRFGLKAKIVKPHSDLRVAEESGMGDILRNIIEFDMTKELPKISVPTLLVWGRYDKPVPLRVANEMHSLIQGSKLVVMDDVGHNAHLENPTLFYGIIKKFIKNI